MELGCFVGNPNGNDAKEMAAFEATHKKFSAAVDRPTHMNAFVDFKSGPLGQAWVDNANWTAWSWSQSPTARAMVPVVGVPLSDNAHWAPNNEGVFDDIAAGKYDFVWSGIARAFCGLGPLSYYRLGYEQDGSFMPWYQGASTQSVAKWRAAGRRVSQVIRATAATLPGKSAKIVWNPANMNWTAQSVEATFFGPDACDAIGLDVYSPRYPGSLYNWAPDDGSYAKDFASWVAKPGNSEHYWDYPGANEWQKAGASGWGMQDTIALCLKHNLPLCIPECGAGNADAGTGPKDDAAFPPWLASRLAQATKAGIPVLFVNIWPRDEWDGAWGFLDEQQPRAAAAWRAAFAPPPAVQPAPAAAPAPLPAAGPASADITDRFGKTGTVTIKGLGPLYPWQTGLIGNVYVWSDGRGNLVVGPDSAWQLPKIVLRPNGMAIRAENFSQIAYA